MRIRLTITKRKKIVLVSFILTALTWILSTLMLGTYLSIAITAVIGYLLTYWVLDSDFKGQEYIVFPLFTIIMLTGFIVSTPIFTQLGLAWAVPVVLFISLYIMFLTTNILNISTIKPLPLVRAAWTSLHLTYFGVSFLLFTSMFWVDLPYFQIISLVFLISFILSYPAYYLLINELGRGGHALYYMFFTGFVMAQVASVFTILDLPFYVKALSLSSVFYIITGVLEHDLRANLNKQTITEYTAIAVLILGILIYLITSYGL